MNYKSCYSLLLLFLPFLLSAQTRQIKSKTRFEPAPYCKKPTVNEAAAVPGVETPSIIYASGANYRSFEELAGTTLWDAISYGSMPQHVYRNDKGEPVATWTFATTAPAFNERGTAYSARAGGAFTAPSARLENVRSGFPSSVILSDGTEISVAHTTVTGPLRVSRREKGASTWEQIDLAQPSGNGLLWPHMAAGGPDGKTVHVIAITTPVANGGAEYEGMNGHLLYWRSKDGGKTWDKEYSIIPGCDSGKFSGFGADEYAIDANQDGVVVGVFPSWNDLQVYKSIDNGDNWETNIVIDFPPTLENYAGAEGDSYDETALTEPAPDGLDPLAVFSSDGWGTVLIDDALEAHAFFGRMYVVDVTTAAGTSFYPTMNGLCHWKEGFQDNIYIITGAFEYDTSQNLTNAGVAPYYNSISSFPSVGTDANGTIYLAYSALHELFKSEGDTPQWYRHVYVMKTEDGGENWGEPIDINTSKYVSDTSLLAYYEGVYPGLPRRIANDRIDLFYQQDYAPGIHLLGPTAAGNHDWTENNYMWVGIPPGDIPNFVSAKEPKLDRSLSVRILPNPAHASAVVTAELEGREAFVEIFDLQGRLVQSARIPAGANSVQLPVERLIPGVYSARVTEGGRFASARLVKM